MIVNKSIMLHSEWTFSIHFFLSAIKYWLSMQTTEETTAECEFHTCIILNTCYFNCKYWLSIEENYHQTLNYQKACQKETW